MSNAKKLIGAALDVFNVAIMSETKNGTLATGRERLLIESIAHALFDEEYGLDVPSAIEAASYKIDALHDRGVPTVPTTQYETLHALTDEVKRARAKHPGNRHLLAALTEEVGELAQAILQQKHRDSIRREALQVACVALRIFEEGDSAFDDKSSWDPKP